MAGVAVCNAIGFTIGSCVLAVIVAVTMTIVIINLAAVVIGTETTAVIVAVTAAVHGADLRGRNWDRKVCRLRLLCFRL